jgi:fatty-acyl-CoA synthase
MNPLAFSTLACPGWSIETVITRAIDFGYQGIEWRGGPQGHVQPTMPPAQKSMLRRRSMDAGLMAIAVTAYTGFVSDLAEERWSNVNELKAYVDLAGELNAPYVRTFIGELPEGANLDSSLYENVSDCLRVVSEYAESVGVRIAVEPHDDFVRASTIVPILNRVPSPALRVIWDLGNSFAAGEDPREAFDLLKDRLAYVQVKDGMGRVPHWQLCSVGEGDVPLKQDFTLLLANQYSDAFSVEWEYAWHPELDPPEIALPAAIRAVRELLAAAQTESA